MKLAATLLLISTLISLSLTVQTIMREQILLSGDSKSLSSQSTDVEEAETETPLLGGIEEKPTDSEEASSQLKSGLQQLASRNLLNTADIEGTTILSFSTQVVAGELYNVLAEVALKDGSYKLLYIQLWDAPWEGVNDAVQVACIYTSNHLIYGIACADASECLSYVQKNGDCVGGESDESMALIN